MKEQERGEAGERQYIGQVASVPLVLVVAPGLGVKSVWFGMFAPAGTPRSVVKQISVSNARIVNLSELKERMQVQGIAMKSSTPEEFTKFVFEEVARLSKVGKAAGVKLD
jgi:tripartite-type tricarboxylate transporter receptor subunit TctC